MKVGPPVVEERFNSVGPFMVERVEDLGYLGSTYRCWWLNDPEKKVVFEGNDRQLEAFFQDMCHE